MLMIQEEDGVGEAARAAAEEETGEEKPCTSKVSYRLLPLPGYGSSYEFLELVHVFALFLRALKI